MKKIFSILLILFSILFINQAFSNVSISNNEQNKVYTKGSDFLSAEGHICKTATDGCNSISIWAGNFGMATEMWCEETYGENGVEKFSCEQYNELVDRKHLDRLYRFESKFMEKLYGVDKEVIENALSKLDELMYELEISSKSLEYKKEKMTAYSFVLYLFNKKLNIYDL